MASVNIVMSIKAVMKYVGIATAWSGVKAGRGPTDEPHPCRAGAKPDLIKMTKMYCTMMKFESPLPHGSRGTSPRDIPMVINPPTALTS